MLLNYRPAYNISLKNVIEYSIDTFGERVATEFKNEILQKVNRLRTMPDMYAKCRFIESNDLITFRNIIIRNYLIIYAVTAEEITVIDIIHGSISPENMKNRIE